MFQDQIVKYSLTSPGEERLYLQTTDNIYVFRDTSKSREYKIKDVSAIFKSNDNDDFILFFEASDDLHASSKKREELLQLLQLRFIKFNRNTTLRIYNIPASELRMYIQTNSVK